MKIFPVIFLALFLLLAAAITYQITFQQYSASKTDQSQFVIPTEFESVRRVLVRTNALEVLIAANGGEVVRHNWQGISLAVDKILQPSNWVVEASGDFEVRYDDEYYGIIILPLKQNVLITKSKMVIRVKLVQPTAHIQRYETEIVLSQHNRSSTIVEQSITTEILVTIPNSQEYEEYIEEQITNSVRDFLENNQQAMTELIERHRGTRLMFRIQ